MNHKFAIIIVYIASNTLGCVPGEKRIVFNMRSDQKERSQYQIWMEVKLSPTQLKKIIAPKQHAPETTDVR